MSDVQLLLLSSAINRTDGSLLPPPVSVGTELNERCRKAIAGLLRRRFVEEQSTDDLTAIWREDGEAKFGAFITAAGRAIVAAPEHGGNALCTIGSMQEMVSSSTPASTTPPSSKIALVTEMLKRTEGANLDELVSATGWLPHSTRAALTGLRKKGHSITLDKSGERTCYRLIESANA